LKTDLAINTPTGYTNSIVLNENQAEDRPIKMISFYPIKSGVVVATYNDEEILSLAQYVYSLDTRLFVQEGTPIITSEFSGVFTLDIASRSSQLTYNENQYFIVLTTTETSYFISANNTEFLSSYNFNNMENNEFSYLTSNDNGTLFVVSQRKTCSINDMEVYLVNVDSNANIASINSYSNEISACLTKKSIQAKYLNDEQVLITYILDNIGVALLLNLSNPTSSSNFDNIAIQQNISSRNFKLEKSMANSKRDIISTLSFNYTNIGYNASQITFSVNGSDVVVSVLRCTNDCCNNCFIEGHLVDIDFADNFLSRKQLNGLDWDLPIVRSPNLGFDRVRFNGDYPLFRYNSLCFNTNINY